MLLSVAPPAGAAPIQNYNVTLAVSDTPGETWSMSARANSCDGACTDQPVSVALVRSGSGSVLAESAQTTNPSVILTEGQAHPGDVLSLRVNGIERASATWDGRPTLDGGLVSGSSTVTGTLAAGDTVHVMNAGGPRPAAAPQSASVTASGENYQATLAQPLACNDRLFVIASPASPTSIGVGTYFAAGYSREVTACPGGPYPNTAVIDREGSDLVLRPVGGSSVQAGLSIGSSTTTGRALDSRPGTLTPGAGCARPAGWPFGSGFTDVNCDTVGASAVRAQLGDAADHITVTGEGPTATVDLGAGDDELGSGGLATTGSTVTFGSLSLIANGGPGNDRLHLDGFGSGALNVDSGPGNDDIDLGRGTPGSAPTDIHGGDGDDHIGLSETLPGASLDGGDGDDEIVGADGTRQTIACGPGADVTFVDRIDVVDRGCAPHLAVPPLTRSPPPLSAATARQRRVRSPRRSDASAEPPPSP
ncbi:MAG: hypothetical protein M3P44_11820 [Actinomycetota bacterium]|nr:hypothetical protein [Actinomycetota bacterium]